MKLNNLLSILLLAISSLVYAQNVPFSSTTFGQDKTKLKTAQKAIREGDSYFDKEQYHKALESYMIAQKLNQNNAELNYSIGSIYLIIEQYNALPYIKKAYELNNAVSPSILYKLGLAYQYSDKFEDALTTFDRYRKQLLSSDTEEIEMTNKRIEECNNAIEIMKMPTRAFIKNLTELNSKYTEHSPVISTDESVMLFTSTRENSVGNKLNSYSNEYDEDIYISYKQKGKWGVPVNVGQPLNSRSDDATVGVSADGQSLLIYNGERGEGDLQLSVLKGDIWSRPEWLSSEINTAYSESSASFANNDRVLYFISERPDGIGGKDIWFSTKDNKNKWTPPINIGPTINTKYDEESVFMHPDGRTLYFSSKGHNNMGGFDIFRSVKQDDDTWTEPENLGVPINTVGDDIAFVISASGRNGYMSSKRKGGMGLHDIYMVTFLGPEKPMVLSNEDNLLARLKQTVTESDMEKTVEIKTIRLTVVKGIVVDAISNNPIEAEIEVIDNEKNEIVFSNKSNSKTGRFLVSLPSGKNYGLAVKAEGYLFHSENFNIPSTSTYQEIEKELKLNNIKKDVKIVLRNVFFDPGKSILKVESYPELNRLASVMKDAPSLKIEISGHTDNTGSATTNQRLSKERAKAVVDYLIAQEIDSNRLTYEGYGFSQPIADNKTEEGRRQNRRVEFKVLSD